MLWTAVWQRERKSGGSEHPVKRTLTRHREPREWEREPLKALKALV